MRATEEIYTPMVIEGFEEWTRRVSDTCERCGQEFWGESGVCDDCRDSDLNDEETVKLPQRNRPALPSFGVSTTKSQNIYFL